MHRLSAITLLSLIACGGGNTTPDAIRLLDTLPADTNIVPGPNLVTLSADFASYIAYRDGIGPWQVLPPVFSAKYDLFITTTYEVVIGCATSTQSEVTLYRRSFDDGPDLFGFCGASTPTPPTTVAVTGSMSQPGEVWMGAQQTGTTSPWSFSLAVPTGNHDLIARSTTNRMLIRRNLPITGATAVPAVDVVANGIPMTAVPLTINGLGGGETLATFYDVLLANDLALFTGSSTTVHTVPASLLVANDFQFLAVDASTSGTRRSGDVFFTGTETTFTLPPVLTGITYATNAGVLAASWATVPSYTELALNIDLFSSSFDRTQSVFASKSWVDATSTTKLAFDIDPPGMDASWKINVAGPHSRSFSVTDNSGTISYSTGVTESVNGAVARELPNRAHHHARLRDARAVSR